MVGHIPFEHEQDCHQTVVVAAAVAAAGLLVEHSWAQMEKDV